MIKYKNQQIYHLLNEFYLRVSVSKKLSKFANKNFHKKINGIFVTITTDNRSIDIYIYNKNFKWFIDFIKDDESKLFMEADTLLSLIRGFYSELSAVDSIIAYKGDDK